MFAFERLILKTLQGLFWSFLLVQFGIFVIFIRLFYVALQQNIVLNFVMHRLNDARFGNEDGKF